jgi:hypothetical protein
MMTGVIGLALLSVGLSQVELSGVEHGTVFYEVGRFAGWPANNGVWSWGDEIVVGFTLGYFDPDKVDGHPIDRDRPSGPMQARSLDGGVTWTIEKPSYVVEGGEELPLTAVPGSLDFAHPDSAMRFRGDRYYYSNDRCRTWQGPFQLPDFDRPGLLARTDYLVNGKHDLTAFLATEKDGGGEGWVCSIRTTDGGKTWNFIGRIGEQPGQGGYAIMPSTLRLKNGALLSIIRKRAQTETGRIWWIDAYLSPNDGADWYQLDRPWINNHGNPAHMIRLADGRIALTYGFREAPYGIRAMISADEGKTWGDEFVLRGDGAGWDLGYPRTVQRADGKCVTMYYFNDGARPERYIAYTIWSPPAEPR